MTLGLALVVVLAAAAGGPSAAAAEVPPRLSVVPSATTVTVGEPFIVTVRAEAPAGTSWSFPAEVATDEVILKAVEDRAAEAGALYQAAVFALDEVAIPPITASYRLPDGTRGEATSEPVAVTVASLLPEDPEEQRLAALRPPVALPAGAAFWIALGLSLVGLGGALAWWWRRRRRAGTALPPPPPEVAPAEEALAALRRLDEAGLAGRGELRTFYIELAVIAKRYLERRLKAPVLEMTSAETAAFLRDHPLARRMAAAVRDLTGTADYVKFAGGQGDEGRARRHWQQVLELVEELERLHAAPPSAQPLERTA